MEEPFQRGNQCAMLEDNTIVATKRTVASVTDSRHDSNSRGKRGCDVQDKRGMRESQEPRYSNSQGEVGRTRERDSKNPRRDIST